MGEVIVALDVENRRKAEKAIGQLGSELKWVKVGMQLYYKEGPDVVKSIKDSGLKVFLDLKLHDIPNTVSLAMKSLVGLGVDMTNLHCLGGSRMMREAKEMVGESLSLIGVTQLTSSSEEQIKEEMKLQCSLEDSVESLAGLAKQAGLNGVVCSAFEAANVKEKLGSSFTTVCPGIRFKEDDPGDQIRVATPDFAAQNGVDYLVMGRSILKSSNPKASLERAYQLLEV